jgi:hypothetical protein
LRAAGFRKIKPTRKPGLTPEMEKARLEFALEHEYWTIEIQIQHITAIPIQVLQGNSLSEFSIKVRM